jgi:putative redox protein
VVITDAPKDNHGKGEAFSPTDLVATALGACMLSIMGIYARNNEIDIEETQVEIVKNMASAPRRIAKIEVLVHMPTKNYSDKEKSALEHAARTCPVSKSLSANLEQDIRFFWV